MSHENDRLWDVKEAAAFMGVSRSWVYHRAEIGQLPHLRVGGLLRFEAEVLKAFVRQDRVSATYAISRSQERTPTKIATR